MVNQGLCLCFIFAYLSYGLAVLNGKSSGSCASCVELEECPDVQSMNTEVQKIWMERYRCDKPILGTTRIYEGFSPVAKGDHICCPQIRQSKIPNERTSSSIYNQKGTIESTISSSKIEPFNEHSNVLNVRRTQDTPRPRIQISNRKVRQVEPDNPFFNENSMSKQVAQSPSNDMFFERNCEVRTSLPPAPETGCCGQDASDADRITDSESLLPTLAPLVTNKWMQYFLPREASKRGPASSRPGKFIFETRIAGGNDTELDQFPWTVLLRIVFNYLDRQMASSCGGSLISPRYVLTAAHCVKEEGAQLIGVGITLAEYDKRTFPRDCVVLSGRGRKCIQNIVIPAEDVIIHPLYEDVWLHNDIALIRLGGFAPYTPFIRPICLAPVNIDIPNLTNLPLTVAGWGRNQQFSTNVKQSTVLNLVPYDQCTRYYPNLSKEHICAAGRSGEDTCKGDSGGPLMIFFRGRYYVMGVVSGKRADSPCGTNVPSLFTNVFNYIDWIQSVIRSY